MARSAATARPRPATPTSAQLKRETDAVLSPIADAVAALPEPHIRAMIPILAQAESELTKDLAVWLGGRNGDERFTPHQMRVALHQLRSTMHMIEKRLPGAMTKVLADAGKRVGKKAIADLRLEVASLAATFGHSVRPIQFADAAILAEGSTQLIPRFRNSANRYAGGVADDIRNQLAVGVARGETFDQLTNRLVRMGGPRGLVALAGSVGDPGARVEHIAEGLFARYRSWAERVVRTEVSNAYNAHHLMALEAADADDPGYQKKWDARRDLACPVCGKLDGLAIALDALFPGGRKHPPAHPNCMCTLVPSRPEWTDPKAVATKAAPAPAHEQAVNAMAAGDHTKAAAIVHDDLASMGLQMTGPKGKVSSMTLPPNLGGFRNQLTGDIVLSRRSAAAAERFAMDPANATSEQATAYQVLVHEVTHAAAPGLSRYERTGALIEEVTTEVTSRWYMRERFGRDTAAGYQLDVLSVQAAISSAMGVDIAEAGRVLEKASVAYRSDPGAGGLTTEHEIVDRFLSHFPVTASVRTIIRGRLLARGATVAPPRIRRPRP